MSTLLFKLVIPRAVGTKSLGYMMNSLLHKSIENSFLGDKRMVKQTYVADLEQELSTGCTPDLGVSFLLKFKTHNSKISKISF